MVPFTQIHGFIPIFDKQNKKQLKKRGLCISFWLESLRKWEIAGKLSLKVSFMQKISISGPNRKKKNGNKGLILAIKSNR